MKISKSSKILQCTAVRSTLSRSSEARPIRFLSSSARCRLVLIFFFFSSSSLRTINNTRSKCDEKFSNSWGEVFLRFFSSAAWWWHGGRRMMRKTRLLNWRNVVLVRRIFFLLGRADKWNWAAAEVDTGCRLLILCIYNLGMLTKHIKQQQNSDEELSWRLVDISTLFFTQHCLLLRHGASGKRLKYQRRLMTVIVDGSSSSRALQPGQKLFHLLKSEISCENHLLFLAYSARLSLLHSPTSKACWTKRRREE